MSYASELRAHYRDVHKRIWSAPPKALPPPAPEPIVVPSPPPRPWVAPLIIELQAVDGSGAPVPSVINVRRAACHLFGLTLAEITGASRTARCVHARQIAIYVCTKMTTASLTRIGKMFGGRDHSTTHHARKKIGRLVETDPYDVGDDVARLVAAVWEDLRIEKELTDAAVRRALSQRSDDREGGHAQAPPSPDP